MPITFVTNSPSSSAAQALQRTVQTLATAMGRVSSGLRISQAVADAAGLAISENLRRNY